MIYELVGSLSSLDIDESKELFADTETAGLYGKVVLVQFMQAGWPKAKLVRNPNATELAFLIAKHHTVWHNMHYDLTTVSAHSALCIPARVDDTFLAARLAQPQYDEYSLDAGIARCIGFDPDKKFGLDKAVLQKSDW